MRDVAVIGAGPAGVSMALSLRDRGIPPLLIDRADEVGSAWRSRYDVLKLNTGRPFSHLPSRPYPKGTPMYPSRDDVVAHLDRHAREDGIELLLGTAVDRIDRRAGGWRLTTSGDPIDARHVVVATGLQSGVAIKDGSIEVVSGVEAFDRGAACLVDGTVLEADAVICATGYRPGLEAVVEHLGVLDETVVPVVTGEKAAAEGLRFLGFSSRPIVMGYVAKESKRVAKEIAAELHGG
jgi:NADPH-dependent 2,4-dienoyl-CoA reductase/sulfur reductase-like enzyme